MSVDIQELTRFKKAAKDAEEQRIRAESARDEALSRLKELGYDSVEEAKSALEEMHQSITDEEADLEDAIHKLFDDYPDLR